MEESIYNLVPKEYVAPEKPPMYHSKHDPLANLTGSTFGKEVVLRLMANTIILHCRLQRNNKIAGRRYPSEEGIC